ncbi:MAG TPA: ABC transporter substrate-binding protein [Candidatus Limnocylindrales bacterium]|nr:ABC transporter substrate-binding protein [Candidatus Limnocylindrales bacterium]
MGERRPENALAARPPMTGRQPPDLPSSSRPRAAGPRLRVAILAIGLLVAACMGSSTARPVPASGPTQPTASVPGSLAPEPTGGAASASLTGGEAAAYGTSYAPAVGTRGGTVILGDWHAATQLNPFYTSVAADMEASRPILRACSSIASDGKYIPDLCSTLPSVANGGIVVAASTFSVTLHLKPGLLWSDGQALTFNDLKYTWQWAVDPAQSNCVLCGTGTAWPLIEAIDVSADGVTATVHFRARFADWLTWLTEPFMPAHYMAGIPIGDSAVRGYPADPSVAAAPFSGPFVIASVSPAEIDYDPNPGWHGGVSPEHLGGPYLDHLKLRVFADPAAEIAAFKSGAVDLALGLPVDSYPALSAVDPAIGQATLSSLWEYDHFGINNDPDHRHGNGLWDPRVRQAIALSVDKSAIATTDFPETAVAVACSPGPPAVWYAKIETCPSYRPAAARELLGQAGWAPDAAGWMAKNGREMNLELCTTMGHPTRVNDLKLLAQDLAAIGVRSHSNVVDGPSVFFARWETSSPDTDCSIFRGNYDISDFGWLLSGMPDFDWFDAYSSTQWPELVHGLGNDTRFANAAADAALGRLATDITLDAQLADAATVQDAVIGGTTEIPLYYGAEPTGVGSHVGNWPGFNPSPEGPTWDVEDWYYKP